MTASSSLRTHSAFVPVALFLAASLTSTVFQWRQLATERAGIASLRAAQQPQIEQAKKLRAQLDSIAAGMQQLAVAGNNNAAAVVEELRKRGVTISAPDPATTTQAVGAATSAR